MRKNIICTLICALFFTGCVLPESVKEGDQHLAARNYIQAVQAYEEALSQTRNKQLQMQIQKKADQARSTLTSEYLKKAAFAFRQQENGPISALENAIAILSQVTQWQDSTQRISQVLKQYQIELTQLSLDLVKKQKNVMEQISKYKFDQANQIADSGLAIAPNDQKLHDLKRNITLLKQQLAEIEDFFNQGYFDQAIAGIKQMNRLSPIALSQNALPSFIKDKLTEYYYQHAVSTTENESNNFKGFLFIEKAMELNNSNPEIFNLHRKLSDYVANGMTSNIAIGSFDSPSHDPDAGKQFSDSLISYLYKMLPYGINILERDNIDYVMKEQGNKNETIAELLGLDLMVTGTVSLFKVEKNIDEREATVKIKVGEKTIGNPEFDQMIKLYGTDQNTWPSKPPHAVSRDVFELLKYNKGQARLTGFANVSFRIFDINKGAISFVKDLAATVKHTSDFQDEVKEANIEYIPMQLPTEIEVKEEMRKQLVEQIGKIVASAFEARERRFFNQANFLLERREHQASFEPIAKGLLYCQKEGIETENNTCNQLRQLADKLLD